MNKITTGALVFLAAGLFTSVSILSGFQVLFAIPLVYLTYLAVKNKAKLPKSSWWLIAFTLIALLSLVVNFELVPKPSKNFGRVKYFFYGVGGIFVLREWLKFTASETKKNLLRVFCLSLVVAGLYAIWQYFYSGVDRASGLTETMRYGYGSAMALLMLLGCILHREETKGWFDFRFAIFAFIVGFYGMYLTFTRGALLGFVCGLPFVLFFYKRKLGLLIGGLALIAVSALGVHYLFGTTKYESRFLVNKTNSSDFVRKSQWEAAVIAIQEKPVLGWGLSNFHSQLKRIKNQYDLDAKFYDDAHSHNLFLEIGSGTGLLGLFFFLGWLITWAIEVFQKKGLVRAIIFPFGVVFCVASQFEVTFDANNASMIFFIYSLTFAGASDV
jgi:O-antigen ligase